MSIQSGGISSQGRTDDGDVKARIKRVKKEGVLSPTLTSETIYVTMTEERYMEVVENVNNGNLFKLREFENGEHYE